MNPGLVLQGDREADCCAQVLTDSRLPLGAKAPCWAVLSFSLCVQVGCAMCQQSLPRHLLEIHEVSCDCIFTTRPQRRRRGASDEDPSSSPFLPKQAREIKGNQPIPETRGLPPPDAGQKALLSSMSPRKLVLVPQRNNPMSPTRLPWLQASDRAVLPVSPQTKECPERPVKCQFCELAVRLNKLEIHEHHCGRQTELCADCGQHIMLRVLAQHRDVCWAEQTLLWRGELEGKDCQLSAGRMSV